VLHSPIAAAPAAPPPISTHLVYGPYIAAAREQLALAIQHALRIGDTYDADVLTDLADVCGDEMDDAIYRLEDHAARREFGK
jgi:hypothetical protein